MKLYQLYFFFLKFFILAHIVISRLGFSIAESPIFTILDTVFKVSIGLFLGFYFWFFRPKGLDWEDSIIISIAGFMLLNEIKFGPLMDFYRAQDDLVNTIKTNSGF